MHCIALPPCATCPMPDLTPATKTASHHLMYGLADAALQNPLQFAAVDFNLAPLNCRSLESIGTGACEWTFNKSFGPGRPYARTP